MDITYIVGIILVAFIVIIFLFFKLKNTNDKHHAEISNLNNKVDELQKAHLEELKKLSAEKSELIEKLEYFTKIREDSANLNEAENIEERKYLIQEAWKELESENQSKQNNSKNIDDNDNYEALKFNSIDTQSERSIKRPKLDDEQKAALRIMEFSDDNLFITGKAGTGKSFLLDTFKENTAKKVLVVAPTGIAALNVGGVTMHSAFGFKNLEELDFDSVSFDKISLDINKILVLKEIDTLVIDEISMVRADVFERIEKILRAFDSKNRMFGGKQIIVLGDLFQLPPIVDEDLEKILFDRFGGIFFFNSTAYKNGNFNFVELTKNHRQKGDEAFFDVLNRIREAKQTDFDLDIINSRYTTNDEIKLERVMQLFPTRKEADEQNKKALSETIKEFKEYNLMIYTYKSKVVLNEMKKQAPNIKNNFPISEELHLVKGALVMMVANDPEKRWVNGTFGIIEDLGERWIKVVIKKVSYYVYPERFTKRKAIFENGKIVYKDIFAVEQYPLVLAYAITIHKSQGMTYEKLACNISNSFAEGQAYVALSRCGSLNGLYLLSKISSSDIKADQNVINFYNEQLNNNHL